MLAKIRIRQNGILSDWFLFTSKNESELKQNPPDSVIIQIKDFYANSPDTHEILEIPYDVFLALAVEFFKQKERQRFQNLRHRDDRTIESLERRGKMALADGNVEDEFERMELRHQMLDCLERLSPKHRKRVWMYYFMGMTQKEIAALEKVDQSAIARSLKTLRKKMKKLL